MLPEPFWLTTCVLPREEIKKKSIRKKKFPPHGAAAASRQQHHGENEKKMIQGDIEKAFGTSAQSHRITPALRRQVWETYMGIGVRSERCPLCGINQIQSTATNSGFQACHVVADKFALKELNVFYLFPGCAVCNNECGDVCLLDFLFARGRHDQLRRMIWSIYTVFSAQYQNDLSFTEGQAWRVLDHLYGPRRFPAGGGIQNTRAIYEIARMEQYRHLIEEANDLARRQQDVFQRIQVVMGAEIKPMVL